MTDIHCTSKAELFAQIIDKYSILDNFWFVSPFHHFLVISCVIKFLYNHVIYSPSGLDPRKAFGPDGVPRLVTVTVYLLLLNTVPWLRCRRLSTYSYFFCVHLTNGKVNHYLLSFIPFTGKLYISLSNFIFLSSYNFDTFKRKVARHIRNFIEILFDSFS